MARPLVARIDCSAFASNIRALQARAKQSEVLLVVKANAYGHDVACLLSEIQGHRIAVASIEEAIDVYNLGFEGEAVLLEGPFSRDCIRASVGRSVVFVVHNVQQLQWLIDEKHHGKVWLKLDSGMHRLGLNASDFEACLATLHGNMDLELEVVMSHFSSADDSNSKTVGVQAQSFDDTIKSSSIAAYLPSDIKYSLCNSAALLFHSKLQNDVVRPGIALYGGSPAPEIASVVAELDPVMSLESQVIALREVPAGDTVGYGDIWTAVRPSHIATVAIGYGDGYPRHAPAGTPVLVDGQLVPLVGRVSMDMITLDVTGLDSVRVGSHVELWGKNLSVEKVAASIGTISYELTTGLTARVPRVAI